MTEPAENLDISKTQTYQGKLLGLLGERDALTVLSSTANEIDKIVSGISEDKMRQRPFQGKWTPTEIIGHLCDAEYLYAYRVKMILCESTPDIHPIDQDLWVAGQKYNEYDSSILRHMFRNLRSYNLMLWKQMGAKEFLRKGRHVQRGEETLGLMLRMNAGHDLSHLDQLRRYLKAIEK